MAEVYILVVGSTNADSIKNSEEEKTCCTTTLIKDDKIVAVVDPGVLDDEQTLVTSLEKQNLKLSDITHIFLTHSHIDHYRNLGVFDSKIPVVEFWGIWKGGSVRDWDENFSTDITIIKTPGHSADGLSFLVNTPKGKIAIVGDVFWKENQPIEDPYAINMEELKNTREKIIKLADFIVPGHGNIYEVK